METFNLKKFWSLSFTLAKAWFKLRNEGSYLGIFWYLLNPLFMFILLLLIFKNSLQAIPYYSLYLLLGIIMFNFFQQITQESTGIITRHKGIIKSINFPHVALIGGLVIKSTFAHIFEVLLFMIILIIEDISLTALIWYIPIIFIFAIFTFGVALIFSALTVYFNDFQEIWAFASRLLWLGTPIFYVIEPNSLLSQLNILNPIFYFITIARNLIIYSSAPTLMQFSAIIAFASLSAIIGIIIFKKLQPKFAEHI